MSVLKKLRRNFPHGLRGLRAIWHKETQFPWQVAFALIVLVLALLLRTGTADFLILLLTLGLALAAEIMNTAIEELCDKIEPSHDPHIGRIKDLGAALVIVAGIPAVVATIVILLPRIF